MTNALRFGKKLRQGLVVGIVAASILTPGVAMACFEMENIGETLLEDPAFTSDAAYEPGLLVDYPNLNDDYTYQRAWLDYIGACYYGPVAELDAWKQTWQEPFAQQWRDGQLVWQETLQRYSVACG
jgi:hypothetical protein